MQAEDRAYFTATQTQCKASKPCSEFLTKIIDSNNEEEDEVEDGSKENEKFQVLCEIYLDDNKLSSYNEKHCESGDFYYLVFGQIGRKV